LKDTCEDLNGSIASLQRQLETLIEQFEQFTTKPSKPPDISEHLTDFGQALGMMSEKVQGLEDEVGLLKAVTRSEQAAPEPQVLNQISGLQAALEKEQEYRKHLEQHFTDRINALNQIVESLAEHLAAPVSPASADKPDPHRPWWLNQYFADPLSLAIWARQVDATLDSVARRNGGGIVFEPQLGSGKFWVIEGDQPLNGRKIAYLLPCPSSKLTIHDQSLLQACFELDEAEGHNGQYRLLHPAVVTPSLQGNQWELLKQGRLKFLSSEPG
jgi:hypothetical protein